MAPFFMIATASLYDSLALGGLQGFGWRMATIISPQSSPTPGPYPKPSPSF